jgi:Zn-dependent protease with chaperone function
LVLIRRVEDVIVGGRTGLRRPTPAESQRLGPSWAAVTKAAAVDPRDYVLWIEKSRKINAYATAGHTVAVTESAVEKLCPAHLEAVLAHELGHHLAGHAWTSLLRYWYSFPALYTLGFATYLSLALSTAIASGSVAMSVGVAAIVIGVAAGLIVTIPVLGIAVLIAVTAPFGLLWVRRLQEHQADFVAAQLGYRTALVDLFQAAATPTTAVSSAQQKWQALVATHPSYPERIRQLLTPT